MFDDVEFIYSNEKDTLLRQTRGIGFKEIIDCIYSGGVIDAIDDSNQIKYPDSQIYVLKINGYVWFVPFIKAGNKVTLKTAYPTRKANKAYTLRGH